jgi:hypothetical protein
MTVAVPSSVAAVRRLPTLLRQAPIFTVHNSIIEINFALKWNLIRKLSWGKESLNLRTIKYFRYPFHLHVSNSVLYGACPLSVWTVETDYLDRRKIHFWAGPGQTWTSWLLCIQGMLRSSIILESNIPRCVLLTVTCPKWGRKEFQSSTSNLMSFQGWILLTFNAAPFSDERET